MFSFPTPRIFKISLRHYNSPIRFLSKNSWVAKIRFKKKTIISPWMGDPFSYLSCPHMEVLTKCKSHSDGQRLILFNMCTKTLLNNIENPKKILRIFGEIQKRIMNPRYPHSRRILWIKSKSGFMRFTLCISAFFGRGFEKKYFWQAVFHAKMMHNSYRPWHFSWNVFLAPFLPFDRGHE